MSSPERTHERLAQKRRTRQALLDAARDLVTAGTTPTVAQAADAATISRATAYRYFPSQEALLVEVPLQLGVPTVQSLFGDESAPTDPEDRAALVHNAFYDHVREHELGFRLYLRHALLRSVDPGQSGEPLRPGGRLQLLDAALRPLQSELAASELASLKIALSVLIGTEGLIVLRDVVGLDHESARASGEWAVRQMVRAARRTATTTGEPNA